MTTGTALLRNTRLEARDSPDPFMINCCSGFDIEYFRLLRDELPTYVFSS